jgi:hypothetical protein
MKPYTSTISLISFIERKAESQVTSWRILKWRLLGLSFCAITINTIALLVSHGRESLESAGVGRTLSLAIVSAAGVAMIVGLELQVVRALRSRRPPYQFLYFFVYSILLGYLTIAAYWGFVSIRL